MKAVVTVTNWAASVGGEHYTVKATLMDPHRTLRVAAPLSQAMATRLNAKDFVGWEGTRMKYRAGEPNERTAGLRPPVRAASAFASH